MSEVDLLLTDVCWGLFRGSEAVAVAYSMVITVFVRRKDSVSALKYYNERKLARGVPDVVTFNTLLDACCRVGDTTNAARLFRDGHRGVHARHHFVQHTHQGILPCGRLECCNGALHVDEEKRNCAQTPLFSNCLLDGCAKSAHVDSL